MLSPFAGGLGSLIRQLQFVIFGLFVQVRLVWRQSCAVMSRTGRGGRLVPGLSIDRAHEPTGLPSRSLMIAWRAPRNASLGRLAPGVPVGARGASGTHPAPWGAG